MSERAGRAMFRISWLALMGCVTLVAMAQEAPPPPVVIGRDLREPTQVIGKNFKVRVWLSNIGGAGIHKIHEVRLDDDGNINIPGAGVIHAEGVPIAQLEAT